MTVRRNRHAPPRMLVALAVVLCALLAGPPVALTSTLGATRPNQPLVLASAFHGDLGVVSRLDRSAGGDQFVRVDQLAVDASRGPRPNAPWAARPERVEPALGQDVAEVPRARAPPSEELT